MVHIDLSFNNIGIIQHGLWRNGIADNRLVNGGGWHWANQIHYNLDSPPPPSSVCGVRVVRGESILQMLSAQFLALAVPWPHYRPESKMIDAYLLINAYLIILLWKMQAALWLCNVYYIIVTSM